MPNQKTWIPQQFGRLEFAPFAPQLVLSTAIALLATFFAAAATGAEIDFNRQVRPILSDKCFACHGPDAEQRQADLRLDLAQEAFRSRDGLTPIIPGEADRSLVLQRIESTDASERMPPEDHPKQLTESEISIIRRWIAEGATWEDHWAFVPPTHVTPPELSSSLRGWARNWIDHFVIHAMHEQGFAPADEAQPHKLLRRLHFDVTGLPPSPRQVEAFARDPSEGHYERIVDELLDSPAYGERMAMYWLDLVRYADTVGYHGDQDVSISPYRDYVIAAFNRNKPFDHFTREQLAGDLLPDPSQEQLVASGYNKLGMMSAEGGVQPEEYLAKYAADRVRNASSVWLGLTLGCAECHDHKYDPLSSKDFYSFASFFADIKERGLYSGANRDGNWGPYVEVANPELPQLLEPLDAEIAAVDAAWKRETPELRKARDQWIEQQRLELERWIVPEVRSAQAKQGTVLKVQPDGSLLASGPSPKTNVYEVEVDCSLDKVTALRLEVLPDPSLPQQGPGRAGNGNFVLSEIRVISLDHPDLVVELQNASATIEQADGKTNPYGRWAAKAAIDADVKGASWGWAVLPEIGRPSAFVGEFAQELPAGHYKIVLEQKHSNPKHTLGKFRISLTNHAKPIRAESVWQVTEQERQALLSGRGKRTDAQRALLDTKFRATTPLLANERLQLEKLQKDREAIVRANTRTSLITVSVEPREMRVLHRGNWMDKSGEVVTPGVPEYFEGLSSKDRANRRDLANWIVSSSNPLTARVFVNRLWKLYFGQGLSKSLDDFGAQGEAPSHPELLDALAIEFVQSGWDVKRVVKLMLMSRAYRQSSLGTQDAIARDPYNRFLARQARFRLPAEMIRDNALAISGLLVQKVGGRSVKPYQPAGLLRHLNFPTRTYQQDEGPNQYRRGVYTHWQRQFLHPAMQIFDAPSREECTAQRARSNTPLAALLLLNDPSYVEAARRFAEQVLVEKQELDSRLSWMMRKAVSRDVYPDEAKVLKELLEAESKHYASHPEKARELVSIGLSTADPTLDSAELAAWTSVTRAVLNMHETITRP